MYGNTLILYVRMVVSLLVSLYTSRVILEILGVEDFGIFNVVGGVVAMLGFLSQSLTVTFQRFFCMEIAVNNIDEQRRIFGASLILMGGIVGIVIIFSETAGLWFLEHHLVISPDRISCARIVFQASIISFAINLVKSIFNAIIISYEKMTAYAYLCIVEVLTKLGIVYLLLLISGDKLEAYAWLVLAVNGIYLLLYISYCRVKFKEITPSISDYQVTLKKLFSFSSLSIVGSMSHIVKAQSLNFILNIFGGAVFNAARAISQQVYYAVYSFVSNFQTAFSSYMLKNAIVADKDKNISDLYNFSFISFHIMMLMIIPIAFNIDSILNLWLGENVPKYTSYFTIMVLIMGVFDALSSPLINIINATGKIKTLQISIFIINICVIPVSILLLKIGVELTSVYIVDLIAVFCSYLVRMCVSCKYTPVKIGSYMQQLLLPVFTILLIYITIFIITNHYNTPINIGITILLEMSYLAGCIYQYRKLLVRLLARYIQTNQN